jgi:hypothetical protein
VSPGLSTGVLLATQQIPALFQWWEKNREKKAKRVRSTRNSRTNWEKAIFSPAEKSTKDGILKHRNQLPKMRFFWTAALILL